jgi:hypothetical protein
MLLISLQLGSCSKISERFSITRDSSIGHMSLHGVISPRKNIIFYGGKRKLPIKSAARSSSVLKTFMIRVKNFLNHFLRRKSHQSKIYSKRSNKRRGDKDGVLPRSKSHSSGISAVSTTRNVGTTNSRLIRVNLNMCLFLPVLLFFFSFILGNRGFSEKSTKKL